MSTRGVETAPGAMSHVPGLASPIPTLRQCYVSAALKAARTIAKALPLPRLMTNVPGIGGASIHSPARF